MLGIEPCNFALKRGIPSKRKSSACVDYVPALCTHRPSLLPIERLSEILGLAQWFPLLGWEVTQTWSFRGSKSRNKVSVGEPAEGSFLYTWSSVSLAKPCVNQCSLPSGSSCDPGLNCLGELG